jgi:hypothetical protein
MFWRRFHVSKKLTAWCPTRDCKLRVETQNTLEIISTRWKPLNKHKLQSHPISISLVHIDEYPNPLYGPEHVSPNCQNNPFWTSRDLKTLLQHQSIYSIILARFQIYIGCSPGSVSGKLCRACGFWKSISCHWQSFIQLMSINPFDDPSIAVCLLPLSS